jgi:Lon protease-like protein
MPTSIVIPVMTLGNCVLLPHQLLPLRIFEPRYRMMLKESLASHRMFAISLLDESQITLDQPEPPHAFTCVGRIANHLEHADGTSHLIIEGLRRARVLKVERTVPYPRLTIAAVVDEPHQDSVATVRDVARILSYSEKIIESLGPNAEPLLNRLNSLTNQPSVLADVAAGHLIENAEQRQKLLGCLSVDQRLKTVADLLAKIDAERLIQGLDEDVTPGLN